MTSVRDAVPGLRTIVAGSWAPNTGSTAFRPARSDGPRCDREVILASGNSEDGGCGGSARHPLPDSKAHHVLWLLAEHGIVCWGPPCGTRQGLVLVDEWISPTPVLERDEHLARFVIRYFAGHGPVTVVDLAWWARLTLVDVRRGVACDGGALCEVAVDETSHWICADSSPAVPQSKVVALPGFNEYLLGYSDRSAALAPEHVKQIVPGTNDIVLPTIISAGRVIGTWRRTVTTGMTELTPEPFDALTPMQSRAFVALVDWYRDFSTD